MKSPLILLILSIVTLIGGISIGYYSDCHKYLQFFSGAAAMWGILGLREYDRICALNKKQNLSD